MSRNRDTSISWRVIAAAAATAAGVATAAYLTTKQLKEREKRRSRATSPPPAPSTAISPNTPPSPPAVATEDDTRAALAFRQFYEDITSRSVRDQAKEHHHVTTSPAPTPTPPHPLTPPSDVENVANDHGIASGVERGVQRDVFAPDCLTTTPAAAPVHLSPSTLHHNAPLHTHTPPSCHHVHAHTHMPASMPTIPDATSPQPSSEHATHLALHSLPLAEAPSLCPQALTSLSCGDGMQPCVFARDGQQVESTLLVRDCPPAAVVLVYAYRHWLRRMLGNESTEHRQRAESMESSGKHNRQSSTSSCSSFSLSSSISRLPPHIYTRILSFLPLASLLAITRLDRYSALCALALRQSHAHMHTLVRAGECGLGTWNDYLVGVGATWRVRLMPPITHSKNQDAEDENDEDEEQHEQANHRGLWSNPRKNTSRKKIPGTEFVYEGNSGEALPLPLLLNGGYLDVTEGSGGESDKGTIRDMRGGVVGNDSSPSTTTNVTNASTDVTNTQPTSANPRSSLFPYVALTAERWGRQGSLRGVLWRVLACDSEADLLWTALMSSGRGNGGPSVNEEGEDEEWVGVGDIQEFPNVASFPASVSFPDSLSFPASASDHPNTNANPNTATTKPKRMPTRSAAWLRAKWYSSLAAAPLDAAIAHAIDKDVPRTLLHRHCRCHTLTQLRVHAGRRSAGALGHRGAGLQEKAEDASRERGMPQEGRAVTAPESEKAKEKEEGGLYHVLGHAAVARLGADDFEVDGSDADHGDRGDELTDYSDYCDDTADEDVEVSGGDESGAGGNVEHENQFSSSSSSLTTHPHTRTHSRMRSRSRSPSHRIHGHARHRRPTPHHARSHTQHQHQHQPQLPSSYTSHNQGMTSQQNLSTSIPQAASTTSRPRPCPSRRTRQLQAAQSRKRMRTPCEACTVHADIALTRLLSAYAVLDPGVGYCQALNFVCGMALTVLPEWDALAVVTSILNGFGRKVGGEVVRAESLLRGGAGTRAGRAENEDASKKSAAAGAGMGAVVAAGDTSRPSSTSCPSTTAAHGISTSSHSSSTSSSSSSSSLSGLTGSAAGTKAVDVQEIAGVAGPGGRAAQDAFRPCAGTCSAGDVWTQVCKGRAVDHGDCHSSGGDGGNNGDDERMCVCAVAALYSILSNGLGITPITHADPTTTTSMSTNKGSAGLRQREHERRLHRDWLLHVDAGSGAWVRFLCSDKRRYALRHTQHHAPPHTTSTAIANANGASGDGAGASSRRTSTSCSDSTTNPNIVTTGTGISTDGTDTGSTADENSGLSPEDSYDFCDDLVSGMGTTGDGWSNGHGGGYEYGAADETHAYEVAIFGDHDVFEDYDAPPHAESRTLQDTTTSFSSSSMSSGVAAFPSLQSSLSHSTLARVLTPNGPTTADTTPESSHELLERVLAANYDKARRRALSLRIMFTPTLAGMQIARYIFSELLRLHLPAIFAHLSHLHFPIDLFTEWFMTMFAMVSIPHTTAARLWDYCICRGPKSVYRVALAVLACNERTILHMGLEEIHMFFRHERPQCFYLPETLIEMGERFKVTNRNVEEMQAMAILHMQEHGNKLPYWEN